MSNILYQLLPIAASLFLLGYIFFLLRGHRVRERYIWVWVLLGVGMLVLSIFPQLAFSVSGWIGFESPSNLLLASCSLFLLAAVINLSTSISGVEEDRRRLVEEIAILDARVRELETQKTHKTGDTPTHKPEL